MSQVRTERIDIIPESLEEIVQACEDAGYKAKIADRNSYGGNQSTQVVEVTGHGIETYGRSVVEIYQRGEGVDFRVDLDRNRAANEKKFQGLKSGVHAHFQKNRAIKASKKRGFTIAQNEETEDKIIIKVRKFVS